MLISQEKCTGGVAGLPLHASFPLGPTPGLTLSRGKTSSSRDAGRAGNSHRPPSCPRQWLPRLLVTQRFSVTSSPEAGEH